MDVEYEMTVQLSRYSGEQEVPVTEGDPANDYVAGDRHGDDLHGYGCRGYGLHGIVHHAADRKGGPGYRTVNAVAV
jgi:hypothetical protein